MSTKIILKFNHNDSDTYPCACLAYKEGEKFAVASTVAKTWDEAEAEALAKAKAMLNVGEPPPNKEIVL